jgi:hypothetical protein
MGGMNEPQLDRLIEKARLTALKVLDQVPLPLHYVLNGVFAVLLLGDVLVPDPIPFVDELLGTALFYYYNVYILKRTFGVINPLRILRGESPAAKRRLGMLPYELHMDRIKARLKAMKKAARTAEIPGLDRAKVDKLGREIKQIESRLSLLDRILTKPEFQEGALKMRIAQLQARIEMTNDAALKSEFSRAIAHASDHLANIGRLQDERNRMVARLERFSLQLDDTYSRLVATVMPVDQAPEAARLFDELFKSVTTFDETLKELEAKPAADLYQAAVKEVEETEEKFRAQPPLREPVKK